MHKQSLPVFMVLKAFVTGIIGSRANCYSSALFDEVLKSGEPDFPFCLAWANENWTRRWDGLEQEILQKQSYGGEEDDRAHFEYILPALIDKRAIKIDNKPIFLFYRPGSLPNVSFYN